MCGGAPLPPHALHPPCLLPLLGPLLQESVKALDQAVAQFVELTKDRVPSFEFYADFNPQFLLEIIKEYLQHCPTEPSDPTDPPSPITEKAMRPLELLVKNVPGSIEGQLLFAKAKFISGPGLGRASRGAARVRAPATGGPGTNACLGRRRVSRRVWESGACGLWGHRVQASALAAVAVSVGKWQKFPFFRQ